MELSDFKKAKYNPRKITPEALAALNKSIEEFGDLSGVVVNKRTNTLVSGHQRIATLGNKKTKIVTEKREDKFGTVEVGHILVKKEDGKVFQIPLRIVDWDIRREKLANIAANNHGGEFDNQKLGKLLAELDTKKFDIELTGFSENDFHNVIRRTVGSEAASTRYVRKLTSPIYEVKGKKPSLSQVFDTTKTDELKAAIAKANLPKDVTKFLNAAAERHTKFRFDLAAEYYAHADKKTQRLMEDCAMIIIDYDRAVELGYVKLTDDIRGMVTPDEE